MDFIKSGLRWLFNMLSDHFTYQAFTGEKDRSYLYPIATAAFGLMLYLGIELMLPVLAIVGFLGLLPFAVLTVIHYFRWRSEVCYEVRRRINQTKKKPSDTENEPE